MFAHAIALSHSPRHRYAPLIFHQSVFHHCKSSSSLMKSDHSSSSPSTPTNTRSTASANSSSGPSASPSRAASTQPPIRRSTRIAEKISQRVEAATSSNPSAAANISTTSLSAPTVSGDVPIPSSSGAFQLAGLREALPHRDPASPAPSASRTSLSAPIQPRRVSTSEERAQARADRIFKSVNMKQGHSPGLEAYFFHNQSADERQNKIWPKAEIGSEEAIGEVIAAINKITGDSRLVACKDSPNYIDVAPDRVETTEKTADVVLLTRASFAHDPTLPSVWALPKHFKPSAKGKGKGKGKGKSKGDDDDDDDDGKKEGKVEEVDLNQPKRSLTHVAAVGETKAHDANAEKQLFRRLSALLATPIREYAVGFTLRGNSLKVYVMNACGVFHTKSRRVTEENGDLSTFLYRLVRHTDLMNGLLATTTSLDDR
ncbi:BQ2448_5541 [Microbotryum intermedium]|uniref:BQ2448_5541 protein n=1 Tax=Microbotryum intermedium TaxID=269621 RepID=A0A238F1K1_9BASI|nr:BQ2448_5541 [Microbotryum intermedium]